MSISAIPYLLEFAVQRKQEGPPEADSTYDDRQMVTVVHLLESTIPVVLAPGFAGVQTKKFDVEKGDDMKDRPPPNPRPVPSPQPKPRPQH